MKTVDVENRCRGAELESDSKRAAITGAVWGRSPMPNPDARKLLDAVLFHKRQQTVKDSHVALV